MSNQENQKSKNFPRSIATGWIITLILFYFLNFVNAQFDSESISGFLSEFATIIFIFGVCGLPIILMLFLLLTFAKRMIDKLPDKNDK